MLTKLSQTLALVDSGLVRDLFIRAYKHLTLAILAVIFVAMIGYVSLFIFFVVSTSWGTPVILSFGHEHVIAARRNWLDLKLRLGEIQSRDLALTVALRDLDASNMLGEGWIMTLRETLDRELVLARLEQGYLSDALAAVAADHGVIKKLSAGFSTESRPENELRAGLIDKLRFMSEKVQEAELRERITSLSTRFGELTVKERQASEKIDSLQSIRQFLDEFASRQIADTSPELIAQHYRELLVRVSAVDFPRLDRSVKDLTLATGYAEQRHQIEVQHRGLEESHRNVRDALRTIESSPIIRAFDKATIVVFAPYTNLSSFAPGQPVYACRFFLLFCWQAGKTGRLVDGEALVPHPMFRHPVRGQFVELDLSDKDAAKFDVLHVGGRPLFFL